MAHFKKECLVDNVFQLIAKCKHWFLNGHSRPLFRLLNTVDSDKMFI